MITISFKTRAQFAVQPIWPTFPLHFANYRFAWEQVFRPVINTVIVCVASIGGTLLVASLAAYAFARFSFPGSRVLFLGVISLLMVPDVLLLVPRYVVTSQLHLLGNYLGLIIPYLSFGSIFAIFVLRTFFASVPGELIEAARMDGASHLTIFWRIMLPLSRPDPRDAGDHPTDPRLERLHLALRRHLQEEPVHARADPEDLLRRFRHPVGPDHGLLRDGEPAAPARLRPRLQAVHQGSDLGRDQVLGKR